MVPFESASSVELVHRKKLRGPADHFGTRFRWPFPVFIAELQMVTDCVVVDFSTSGAQLKTPEGFAAGHAVTVDQTLTHPVAVRAAIARLRAWIREHSGYDLLARNCEHVARYIVSGDWKSPQVLAITGITAIAVVLLILALRE